MSFEELVVSMRYELDFLRISHNYSIQVLPVPVPVAARSKA